MPTEPTPEQVAMITAEMAPMQAQIDASKATPVAVNQSPASGNELARGRDAWIAMGKPAASYDAALAADGLKLHEAAPNPLEPVTGATYAPNWTETAIRDLPVERLAEVQRAAGELLSAMRMPSGLGADVAEMIATEGPRYAAATPPQREDWLRTQLRLATKATGSEEAAQAVFDKARAVLQNSGVQLGREIAASKVIHFWPLARSLAAHANRIK